MSTESHLEADPLLGLVIADAIRLEAAIGAGTTGRVYRGRQLGLERNVAVKILHPFLVTSPEVKMRFFREARLMARLDHPGIVRLLDSGELLRPTKSTGEAFLVYEYLEGETLRDRLRRVERVGLDESIASVLAIADAIAQAHERNIIHRDLKPENVMSVQRDNDEVRLVVLDFGLARALDAESAPLTREGALLGTPQYMSPEVAHGEPASCASDVYALATMLYELCCGHPPFYLGTALEILAAQANTRAPGPEPSLGLPHRLESFLSKNLEKSPTARCRDAGAFRDELREATCVP